MDLNLKGQRILVVGASEGIGHATVSYTHLRAHET